MSFNRHEYIRQRRAIKLSNYGQQVKDVIQEIIAKEFEISDCFTREGIIAKEVNVTTWKSFCRFGDRNWTSKAFKRNWIRDKAEALDVQAMYITETYGMEVLPDELAQFMMEHENGKGDYLPYAELADLKGAFKELTGFRWEWNPKFFKESVYKNFSIEESTDYAF